MQDNKENNLPNELDMSSLRGTSICQSILLLDDIKNNFYTRMDKGSLEMISARINENTKVVFVGDEEQVSSPYLSKNKK